VHCTLEGREYGNIEAHTQVWIVGAAEWSVGMGRATVCVWDGPADGKTMEIWVGMWQEMQLM